MVRVIIAGQTFLLQDGEVVSAAPWGALGALREGTNTCGGSREGSRGATREEHRAGAARLGRVEEGCSGGVAASAE